MIVLEMTQHRPLETTVMACRGPACDLYQTLVVASPFYLSTIIIWRNDIKGGTSSD